MNGTIVAVCVSPTRREPKKAVDQAFLIPGGIRGDSHFGVSPRQVSLLRQEDIDAAAVKAGFPFPPGSLAENLVVRGLPGDMRPGTVLSVGTVVLRVIERGKRPDEPHSYDYRGYCLLPSVGYFLEVLHGGVIRPGDVATVSEDGPSDAHGDHA